MRLSLRSHFRGDLPWRTEAQALFRSRWIVADLSLIDPSGLSPLQPHGRSAVCGFGIDRLGPLLLVETVGLRSPGNALHSPRRSITRLSAPAFDYARPVTLKQRKGFALFLRCCGGISSYLNLPRKSSTVGSLTMICPGPAAPHRRAEVLAVSPITV